MLSPSWPSASPLLPISLSPLPLFLLLSFTSFCPCSLSCLNAFPSLLVSFSSFFLRLLSPVASLSSFCLLAPPVLIILLLFPSFSLSVFALLSCPHSLVFIFSTLSLLTFSHLRSCLLISVLSFSFHLSIPFLSLSCPYLCLSFHVLSLINFISLSPLSCLFLFCSLLCLRRVVLLAWLIARRRRLC